ncbi:unnamed protein product [Mytilus edulis]|uniref:Uncharacterized protein n=1 Tax=Mytilus edulis TaxID=6550 RepID=A0A8S3SND6_MYTED|nr:unnamed protein product [Mytilus edulis]
MDEYKRVTLSPKPYRVEKYNSTPKRLPSPHSPIKKALSPSYESTYLGDQYDTPEIGEVNLKWWVNFMNVVNGTVTFLDSEPVTCFQTDACLHGGAGYYEGDFFFYVNWDTDLPNFKNYHINIKETMAIVLSAMWTNKRVVVSTENLTTKCIINKNKTLMTHLRELFWLSATHNFEIRATFFSGCNNVIAEAASRLHEPGQLSRLYDKFVSHLYVPVMTIELLNHISIDFLIPDEGTMETQMFEKSVILCQTKFRKLEIDQGHSQKAGIFTEAQAANLKMIEICPKTFCFIPIKTKAIIFGAVSSRGELAARLLRAFYTEEELRDAKSLGNLRNGAVIISAIIDLSECTVVSTIKIGTRKMNTILKISRVCQNQLKFSASSFLKLFKQDVQKIGLAASYRRRPAVKSLVRKVIAFGYLPIAVVRQNFRLLRTSRRTQRLCRLYNGLKDFLTTSERNYMNGLFPPQMWNTLLHTNNLWMDRSRT